MTTTPFTLGDNNPTNMYQHLAFVFRGKGVRLVFNRCSIPGQMTLQMPQVCISSNTDWQYWKRDTYFSPPLLVCWCSRNQCVHSLYPSTFKQRWKIGTQKGAITKLLPASMLLSIVPCFLVFFVTSNVTQQQTETGCQTWLLAMGKVSTGYCWQVPWQKKTSPSKIW